MNESVYTCAICGKEHNCILSRAKCEIECANRVEEEAKKAAEAKKQAEYNARVEEVNKAFDNAYKLRDELMKDYGCPYTYNYHKYIKDHPYTLLSWTL